MSVTCLTHNNKPSWVRPKSIAISSSSLDALMSTTNSKEDDKSSHEKQSLRPIQKSSLKRPLDYDEGKLTPTTMKFVPSQILKAKRTIKSGSLNRDFTEIRIVKRISPSFDTRYSTPSSSSLNTSSSSSLSSEINQDECEKSSEYLTPENKWKHTNTWNGIASPRAKRSLFDHSHSTSISSLDSSVYCTPDRSPSEFDSEVKRKKSRWSVSSNLVNLSDSVSSDYLNGSFASVECSEVIQPELIGYQMVGDSQFCRFGQQLLGLKRVPAPNSPGRIGICVSGQTISDLHRRVKDKFYPISDKIILMIGTNDFLRNKDVTMMCQELSQLISTLQKTVTNIILLTLPPIPKLARNGIHFRILEKYNQYIRSLEDGDRITIADISPLYISSRPQQRCIMELFEMYFPGPAQRFDMIHLNRNGLEVIRDYICEHFL